MPQEEYIPLFRKMLSCVLNYKDELSDKILIHSHIAKMEDATFGKVFSPLFECDRIKYILSPLVVIKSLPDLNKWEKYLSVKDDDKALYRLYDAVAGCFNHQSQASTDCRWFKIMTMIAQDRFKFPIEMQKLFEEIIDYPNAGDMRKIRPAIRSAEIATRNIFYDDSSVHQNGYNEDFWSEWQIKSECIINIDDVKYSNQDRSAIFGRVHAIYEQINEHFQSTLITTKVDAKHDAAFGLVFFICHLTTVCLLNPNGHTTVGRIALRAVVEAYINLSYLSHHDNPTVWMQYRNYGNGQNRLAYLKTVKDPEGANFISRETLEQLANEDMWHEFLDIKLGAWDGKDLRKMAVEAKVKDVYDRYYNVLSAYVHANWMAVRHSVFGQCMNPLHRFHRIPLPPKTFSEDVIPDMIKLLNLSLDRLNHLYPQFKPRIHTAEKG